MINVSNIERFAIKDGPGIRTAVFLKGCPLHCPWCANPETWFLKPVLMHKKQLCVGCRQCEKACPNKAIEVRDRKAHIDYTRCIRCYCCHELCPVKAVHVKRSILRAVTNS